MSSTFNKIFPKPKPIIGMIHIQALPGTPAFGGSSQAVIDHAMKEAEIYLNAGIDALALENMHDVPYIKNEVGHEISTLMSIIAYEVKRRTQLPCGIQVLAAANEAALAIAKSANLDFIRAEAFVYGHVADEGYIDSNAGTLLRYRKMIDADGVAVFTDIKKKHSAHSITADVSLLETAQTAAYFRSDGLIVTGFSTGEPAAIEELKQVKAHCDIPVMTGSGVTIDNLADYLKVSDALIVGSWFKKDGHWANEMDPERIKRFMETTRKIRKS